MSNQAEDLTELFRRHWDHDRDALLRELINRPDVTGAEIEQAIEVAGQRREAGLLARALRLPSEVSQGLGG